MEHTERILNHKGTHLKIRENNYLQRGKKEIKGDEINELEKNIATNNFISSNIDNNIVYFGEIF